MATQSSGFFATVTSPVHPKGVGNEHDATYKPLEEAPILICDSRWTVNQAIAYGLIIRFNHITSPQQPDNQSPGHGETHRYGAATQKRQKTRALLQPVYASLETRCFTVPM
jgi:hypothetical protein